MREAKRVDLRNGTAVGELIEETSNSSESENTSISSHPVVYEIMAATMSEEHRGEHADGNWGLWNFHGNGPLGAPPRLVVGRPGA